MKIEFKTYNNKDFTAGDIVTLKADAKSNRTTETHYYLIGIYDKECSSENFYLTDIKTGELLEVPGYLICVGREELTSLIKHYQGKVYRGDKAKLILKERTE